jgi:hypothetical protein
MVVLEVLDHDDDDDLEHVAITRSTCSTRLTPNGAYGTAAVLSWPHTTSAQYNPVTNDVVDAGVDLLLCEPHARAMVARIGEYET